MGRKFAKSGHSECHHILDYFLLPYGQCDQIATLFYNLWPFTTMTKLPSSRELPKLVQKFAKC